MILNSLVTQSSLSLTSIVGIRPVRSNILLVMLASGQEIVLEAHCTKGIGKEHIKWSPVATVWYRFAPETVFLQVSLKSNKITKIIFIF